MRRRPAAIPPGRAGMQPGHGPQSRRKCPVFFKARHFIRTSDCLGLALAIFEKACAVLVLFIDNQSFDIHSHEISP
jgi:hypothetical protein